MNHKDYRFRKETRQMSTPRPVRSIEPLSELHSRVKTLISGRTPRKSPYDDGFCSALGHVLAAIESLGGPTND